MDTERTGSLTRWGAVLVALVTLLVMWPNPAGAQVMIIGNDNKVTWDKTGKQIRRPPDKDSVSIVDISSPEAPKIVASLPLVNSVFGPPTNLATPFRSPCRHRCRR